VVKKALVSYGNGMIDAQYHNELIAKEIVVIAVEMTYV
jgi:hypothetical protein